MKPAITFSLGVLLFIAAALAQTPAQNDVRPATIEGLAKNAKTGEPLADVRVTMTPEFGPATAPRSATTDSDGKFTITNIPPGRYNIAATRTLFFRPRRNVGTVAVTLTADQKLNNVQIPMMPTGVIAGRIVDENREPLRSVRIEAFRNEYVNGVRSWVNSAQNTTDDRGEYRLFNLQPGTYYIRATQSNLSTGGQPLYYPGVADSQDASPVQIEAGGELGAIDIGMRRTSEYSVRFKVGGVPVGGVVTVTVQQRNAKVARETVLVRAETQPDNNWIIPKLAPGAYDIFVQIATPPTGQPRAITHAAKIPVNIGRANEDLGTVAVRATVPVTGRIVAAEALPSTFDLKRLTLTFQSLDLPATVNVGVRGGATPPGFNDDGTFTVANVAAARYRLTLTGLPTDTSLVSARSAGKEVLDIGYAVSGDQSPLEIVIGGPGSVGTVEGTVLNVRGEPVSGSTVVLVPAMDRRVNPGAFRTATTDQQGNFLIRSVLVGEYKAIAWEDVEPGAYMDPEFLKDFETRGESLRIQKGSQNTVGLKAIPAS